MLGVGARGGSTEPQVRAVGRPHGLGRMKLMPEDHTVTPGRRPLWTPGRYGEQTYRIGVAGGRSKWR